MSSCLSLKERMRDFDQNYLELAVGYMNDGLLMKLKKYFAVSRVKIRKSAIGWDIFRIKRETRLKLKNSSKQHQICLSIMDSHSDLKL